MMKEGAMSRNKEMFHQILSPHNRIAVEYLDLNGNPTLPQNAEGVITTLYDENGKLIKSSLRVVKFKNR
jgi:hypothetical protein